MQDIFIVTPVVEPNRLGAMYNSMDHADVPLTIHWIVIFDAAHINHYQAWKNVFAFGQVDNVTVHCVLSDRSQQPDKPDYNRNITLDILENHVLKDTPQKKSSWVYQLDDTYDLPPFFCAYFYRNEEVMRPYNLILMGNPTDKRAMNAPDNQKLYAFRMKLLNGGLRYSPRNRNEFLERLIKRGGLMYIDDPKKIPKIIPV